MGMFQNVQKALGVAQQVMPMVQKFGPMVKNVPALINMAKTMRELKNTNNDHDDKESVDITEVQEANEKKPTKIKNESKGSDKKQTRERELQKPKRKTIPTNSQTHARSTAHVSSSSGMGYKPVMKTSSQPTIYV